jgi:DNA-binding MarR family transcriptional regulator
MKPLKNKAPATNPGAEDLGRLLAEFVNKVSHPRGRALAFMTEANVTVPQVLMLDHILNYTTTTPSELSGALSLSPSSVSQMIDRLVKGGFLTRFEDAEDRRRKTIVITARAKQFLDELGRLRVEEFEIGTSVLSAETRNILKDAITVALGELRRPRRTENLP